MAGETMINETILNNMVYKMVCIYRNDGSVDTNGAAYPFPEQSVDASTSKNQLLERLVEIQNHLDVMSKDRHPLKKPMNCLLCDKKKIATRRYVLAEYIWEDALMHYIDQHNVQPPESFVDRIFNYSMDEGAEPMKLFGRIIEKKSAKYIKLDRNQIMILDALMKHGGYTKKYADNGLQSNRLQNNKASNLFRYSEHAGFLDIESNVVDKIIVAGDTVRVDRGDEEIFLPGNIPDAMKYEYIFHTHPPTPRPGGRAVDGILYEFPSTGDMLHFIDHYNDGKTVGSLVMTSEGLYNIKKKTDNNKKIRIDEDRFYNEMKKVSREEQRKAIKIYGDKFSTYEFYSKISKDTQFIDSINLQLDKYEIKIDFYPRIKDAKGSWIVDTIHLPLPEK